MLLWSFESDWQDYNIKQNVNIRILQQTLSRKVGCRLKHTAYGGFLFKLMWKFLDNLFVDIAQNLIMFLYFLSLLIHSVNVIAFFK